MRDDFDSVVAHRFKVLDQVPVLDTWSRVQFKVLDQVPVADTWSPVQFTEEEAVTMIDVKTTDPTEHLRKKPMRVVVDGILAVAAAVVAIAFVASRDADDVTPVDEPSTTVTVPAPPPQPLFGTSDVQLTPGTYFVDKVDGTPTPRILVTVGAGWSSDGWGVYKGDGQWMTFSRPDRVFLDSCHPSDGFHPGPMTTLDGLVAALSEQGGWAEVTTPTDITVDGYAGKAFQRTTPANFADCTPLLGVDDSVLVVFPSWENEDESGNKGWSYYPPGDTESLVVLDLDGTIIILETRVHEGQPAAAHTEIAAVLDSIRIDPG
jgi:hypothetical protein